jgi:hypothetical protein
VPDDELPVCAEHGGPIRGKVYFIGWSRKRKATVCWACWSQPRSGIGLRLKGVRWR